MINQKLQDFEEDVKALGDLMTQVIDFAHNYTGLTLGYLWFHKNWRITEIVYIFVFFLGNHWYLQRHRCQNASDSYQDTLPF